MKWIEILGPSGIGKTYLKEKLFAHQGNTEYSSLEDALKAVALRPPAKNDNHGIVDILLKFYLKQNIVNTKKRIIIDNFLNYKEAYLSNSINYRYLLESCINYYLKSNKTAEEKTYRISLFKLIIEKMASLDYYKYDKTVIFDEGPFNHSHKIDFNLIKKNSYLPSGFIFCNARPEAIINRVKKRSSEGRTVPAHKFLSDKELGSHIFERYNDYLIRMEIFKELGVPYIEVNLENEIDLAVEEVTRFLKEKRNKGEKREF
jgi:hypothetical protein